ncbi:MAG: hypothetical protein ABR921_08520 [Candidatus Sulfotelmatobacter sp.]|jgi:hypothetical protein
MSAYRVALSLVFVLLLPCLSQQVGLRFNDSPQLLRDVLKDAHVSGSVVFSGGCKFQDRNGPLPHVGMRRDFGSVRETLQHMLAVNSKIRVTQDSDGMVRIAEAGVATDILDVKIHHLSFPASTPQSFDDFPGPLYMHGPFVALMAILATPEVTAFQEAHHIDFDSTSRVPGNLFSPAKSPEVSGELSDVTLSEALDYVLKTFPGYWVYEDASCENGSRSVRFEFY